MSLDSEYSDLRNRQKVVVLSVDRQIVRQSSCCYPGIHYLGSLARAPRLRDQLGKRASHFGINWEGIEQVLR